MLILFALLGLIYTDLVGYFSHKLLHSGKIDFLYRLHMEHHITNYPPTDLRSSKYRETKQRKILGAGPEWALPIGSFMALTALAMIVVGVPWLYMTVFFCSSLLYALVAYSWLHDQFHLWNPLMIFRRDSGVSSEAKFWIPDSACKWFAGARTLHDVHHRNMKKNYGIGSYWLDKLFGTYEK